MLSHSTHGPFFLCAARVETLPIVFDSPHSGIDFPPDFSTIAPRDAILTTWDAFVDELWSGVPNHGAVLLGAHFPRAYIDPNRALTDIDAALLAESWPAAVEPQSYTARGMGLIRRCALPDVPLYDRLLSVSEISHRINTYYLPYRNALQRAADDAFSTFDAVWHINCHSMKSRGNAMNVDQGQVRPDVVISDRCGASSDPLFTHWAAAHFKHAGYSVQVNTPYQGGDLVRALGQPKQRRNSIQIELNRALYLNETTFEKHARFDTLQSDLDDFSGALAAHVRKQLKAHPRSR